MTGNDHARFWIGGGGSNPVADHTQDRTDFLFEDLVGVIISQQLSYLYGEEERLVRTVVLMLQRDLLTLPFLAAWLGPIFLSNYRAILANLG